MANEPIIHRILNQIGKKIAKKYRKVLTIYAKLG